MVAGIVINRATGVGSYISTQIVMNQEEKKIDRTHIKSELKKLDSRFNLVHHEAKAIDIFKAIREIVRRDRDTIKFCPCCDQAISNKKVSYSKTDLAGMYAVMRWCQENERVTFETKEIKRLLSLDAYAGIGHWKTFGGLFFKPEDPELGRSRKALWGINMDRAEAFFAGNRLGPVQIVKDRFTDEIIASTDKYVQDFPDIKEFLNEMGLYENHHVVSDHDAHKAEGRPTVAELSTGASV